MIALIFMGARLRYIFLIALLTVGGIFTTVLSFLLGIYTHSKGLWVDLKQKEVGVSKPN